MTKKEAEAIIKANDRFKGLVVRNYIRSSAYYAFEMVPPGYDKEELINPFYAVLKDKSIWKYDIERFVILPLEDSND